MRHPRHRAHHNGAAADPQGHAAGYRRHEYSIVVQNYPSLLSPAKRLRCAENQAERGGVGGVGGCPCFDDANAAQTLMLATIKEPVLAALRAAHERGARLLSVCTRAFVLGAAGLLDGRRCTTHWRYAGELAARFPRAHVDPDVLYVDADPVITSAGSAAGLDACLHLIRKEFGAQVASTVARRMVVPPYREGGQAQFVRTPLPQVEADTLAPLLSWLGEHLDQPLTVPELAARVHMSPRTFARRFRDEIGTTPHHWLTHQRVLLAERLLEETALPVDAVARRTGFGNAATLRHHFGQARSTTPQAYRQSFGCRRALTE